MNNNELTPLEKINLKNAEDGKQILAAMREESSHPMEVNEALLMRILDMNKDTEYGRKYHFADIHSVEDYRNAVPVTTYDDYADYILRMTEKGEIPCLRDHRLLSPEGSKSIRPLQRCGNTLYGGRDPQGIRFRQDCHA